jgi:hypothetical protein
VNALVFLISTTPFFGGYEQAPPGAPPAQPPAKVAPAPVPATTGACGTCCDEGCGCGHGLLSKIKACFHRNDCCDSCDSGCGHTCQKSCGSCDSGCGHSWFRGSHCGSCCESSCDSCRPHFFDKIKALFHHNDCCCESSSCCGTGGSPTAKPEPIQAPSKDLKPMPSDPKKTGPGKTQLDISPKGEISLDSDVRNPLDLRRN